MSDDDIIKTLRSLASSSSARSPAARLKDYISEIDAAIAAGVKPELIEETLKNMGLALAPTALRGALYRYRKALKAQGVKPAKASMTPRIPTPFEKGYETAEQEPASSSVVGAYKSDLTPEEKNALKALSPTEKIAFFRSRERSKRFTHDPTPQRFRNDGD